MCLSSVFLRMQHRDDSQSVNERLYEVSLGACPPDYVVEDHALRLVNLTVCAHHPLTASSAVPRLIFFNTERIREN